MFLKGSELDGNNGDPVDSISDDQVVPFSATSPRRNILSRDSSPDLSRSPQYQERLNRGCLLLLGRTCTCEAVLGR